MNKLSLEKMLSDSANQYARIVQGSTISQEEKAQNILFYCVNDICQANLEKTVNWIDDKLEQDVNTTSLVLAVKEIMIRILDEIEKCKKSL